jgi:hypothetical protein
MRAKLAEILRDPPQIHREETEVTRDFSTSGLSPKLARSVNSTQVKNYGIGSAVVQFIFDHIDADSESLETGCGLSTLVFATKKAKHTSVTADPDEPVRLGEYAQKHQIDLGTIRFLAEPSEKALPKFSTAGLDLVLLDGKHAFPWPIVDWFYTADLLKRGGVMLVDDCNMRSVGVLVDFLKSESDRWCHVAKLGRTEIFEKKADSALDVAWRMQPWMAQSLQIRDIARRIRDRVRSLTR